MTSLVIRVRESRLLLPPAEGHRLVVEVPPDPLKVDRGTLIFPSLAETAERLMLKVYGQMGTGNWLRKQVVGYRAGREFRTLDRLRRAGIPCCEPMFWGTGRSREHGLFEVVATREIPDAGSLAERSPDLSTDTRAAVLGSVFEILCRMHRTGVFHGACFLTNVLLSAHPAAAGVPWIIDLEKSVCFDMDIRGTRMAEYDLLCAVASTFIVMGAGYARGALERYGLGEAAIARVFSAVNRSPSSKFFRYRLRAEFLARGVVSRLRARRGRRFSDTPAGPARDSGIRAPEPADSARRTAAPM
jgi:hypothetical protein